MQKERNSSALEMELHSISVTYISPAVGIVLIWTLEIDFFSTSVNDMYVDALDTGIRH